MKFDNTEVFNFKGALRGMRNPLNSWVKSDSFDTNEATSVYVPYCIGENDLALAQRLIKAGNEHRKFMRQIIVSVDITAPMYWWKEYDTYKVGTVANSTSTMHKIHSKPFELSDFEVDNELLEFPVALDEPDGTNKVVTTTGTWVYLLRNLEGLRQAYVRTNDKRYWKALIQLLPSSYNQTRTCTLSYENILAIRHQRKNHKLTEWSVDFMKWIEELPYANELLFIE